MRHRLEYAAALAVMAVVRVSPWRLVRGLGSAIGFAFYVFDGTHRRITRANLARAFPHRGRREINTLSRRVFAHFGRFALELLKFGTLAPDEMLRRVDFEGDDRARQAYAHGRGVIFFTGHFGFWELNGIVHALRIAPIGVLARALDNPYLNAMLERLRQKTGNTVIYRKGAMRKIMRALGANGGVAVLIDQHIHTPDRVFVDFFDRPAATTATVAMLAHRTGAVVIPVFAIPKGPARYKMIYEPPVPPPADGSPEAIRDFTQRCTDVLEMYVRRYPELWLWMHRRWRDGDVPEGARGMFPSASRDQSSVLQNGEEIVES